MTTTDIAGEVPETAADDGAAAGAAPLAFARLLSEPWAVTEEFADVALDIVCRRGEGPEALSARLGRKLEGARAVTVRDGVAVLPVHGPIMRHASLMTEISGATSVDQLAADLNAALDDPSVAGIVLDVDSPGGQAKGIGELADMIRAADGRKPVAAYVGGQASSAAYWLAAAAPAVVAHPTASLGSIGVVLRVLNPGLRKGEHQFVSSVSPHKRPDLTSDEGRRPTQSAVDDLGRQFVEAVAGFREVPVAHALERFGGGATMTGRQAKAAGMVDRLGSLEGLIADLQKETQAGGMVPRAASARGITMAAQPGPAATPDLSTISLADLRAARPDLAEAIAAEGRASGVEAGRTEAARADADALARARAEARTAERTRIGAILGCEAAQGRGALALALATESDMGAEQAAAMLAKAPKEAPPEPQKVEVVRQATDFEQHMAKLGNPKVGAEAAQDDEIGALVQRFRAREGRAN